MNQITVLKIRTDLNFGVIRTDLNCALVQMGALYQAVSTGHDYTTTVTVTLRTGSQVGGA